jgi:hypothetical protein
MIPGSATDHGPGVVGGLQQARDEQRLEVADRDSPGFQADVHLIGVGKDITEGVPPAGLPGVAGELDEALALGAGDAVKVQEVPHASGLGMGPAGLDAEDRGG